MDNPYCSCKLTRVPEGNWGEWLTIAEQKGVYDGFETAIGRQIADDTLAQYKQAFNLFDADGGGSIDVDELGTLMKSLGQEADEAELTRLIQMADADGNGDIDFDEFLAIMTSKLHGQEGALEAAKQGYWALQSYKFKSAPTTLIPLHWPLPLRELSTAMHRA